MVDLLGERGKKNQGVQHKNCQEPALQMTAKTSGAQLSQPLKLPLRLRSTRDIKKAVFLMVFSSHKGPWERKKLFLSPNGISVKSNRVSSGSCKQTSENGMTQSAVARPTLALDTTVEFWFDPANAVRTRRHGPRASQGGQAFFQFDGLGSREAQG